MAGSLDRRVAIPKLIGNPDDFLIVAGLAGTAKDIGSLTREAPNTFLFGGAMGGATMAGLGLALAQPKRRVLVATGDGDLLMSLGSLATIAAVAPANLAVLCVDNELYGETGNQRTHTGFATNLAVVAQGCGIPVVHEVATEREIEAAANALRTSNGPVFVLLKVDGGPPPAYSRNWHADETKTAFRRALLGRR
jgi:thiamine pyrophosphate-dependent acetolactate synthase large subunit-like protein